MDWKKYLTMVLGALIPILYSVFIKNNPSFPLNSDYFYKTIMWIIEIALYGAGYSIVGWQLKNRQIEKKRKR